MLTGAGTGAAGSGTDAGFARAAVVGAGLMGRRLAGVLAGGGLRVTLTDVDPAVLPAAVAAAAEVAAEVATGVVGEGAGAGQVRGSAELADAVAGADLVIEAVTEDLSTKQQLLARIGELVPAAVLATNTSVLPVTAVAERVADGSRVLGTHWWNPPDLIPVVEVVRGERTADEVVERVIGLLRRLGKQPVRVDRDVPGFIGNRLQHALWREAFALVDEGVCDPETVDLVVRNTLGLRLGAMGPLENADYVGLDLTLAIHQAVLPGLNRDRTPSPLLRAKVAAGELGARSGRGLMAWPPGSREVAARRLAGHVAAQLAARRAGPATDTEPAAG